MHTLHQIAVTFNMTLSEFLDFPELNDYPIDDEELLTYMVVNVPCAIQNQVLSLVLQFIADAQLPLEQRAHFYTGANPVCALCEANSLDS